MASVSFVKRQQDAQAAYFARTASGFVRPSEPYRLQEGRRDLNLAPGLREVAEAYFGAPRNITWHQHADHGLSSQVCCLNFLAPLARHPALLAEIIGATLNIDAPRMLPIEDGPGGAPWFVGFEWPGRHDYLSEWKAGAASGPRGQNATNADAIVRFEHDGGVETLLIEWKYTESYGSPIDPKGNATRVARYADKAFAPDGPLRADLGLSVEDFFWEPFYQLMRQQMLAQRMQAARDDGADRVRVLHISPAKNEALHKVTAPRLRDRGEDAFEVFRNTLVNPADFISRSTEQVFGDFIAAEHSDAGAAEWSAYLRDRYAFLND